MYASNDPVEFVLNRNLSDIPGQKNNYKSGLTTLLGDFTVDVINDGSENVNQLIAHFELRSVQLDKVEY